MKRSAIVAFVIAHAYCGANLFADTFGSGANQFEIEFVTVGDPGNPHDITHFNIETRGSVLNSYRIGKFEVTNHQYVQFLNSVDPNGLNDLFLFDFRMSLQSLGGIVRDISQPNAEKFFVKNGRANQPVAYISWFDAVRFTNWLHNSQSHGDTESGAYTLGPLGDRAVPIDSEAIQRNPNADYFLPSVDEWHKAAYYQPPEDGGDPQGYWDYPMQTNAQPFSAAPPGNVAPDNTRVGNFEKDDGVANDFDNGPAIPVLPGESPLTDVGAYAHAKSFYGTYDQGGNVWEMTDTYTGGLPNFIHRRGGGWSGSFGLANAGSHGSFRNTGGSAHIGFRVASRVPEPSTLFLTAIAACGVLLRRWR